MKCNATNSKNISWFDLEDWLCFFLCKNIWHVIFDGSWALQIFLDLIDHIIQNSTVHICCFFIFKGKIITITIRADHTPWYLYLISQMIRQYLISGEECSDKITVACGKLGWYDKFSLMLRIGLQCFGLLHKENCLM